MDTEFTKNDERRLRDYIHKLKHEQSTVNRTVMELESVYADNSLEKKKTSRNDAQRLDLENAVIMQELMAIKVFNIVGETKHSGGEKVKLLKNVSNIE